MYPLALLALDLGMEVSGSDVVESDNTKHLRSLDVAINLAQDRDSIAAIQERRPIDWLIASSAVAGDSPELAFAREQNIRFSKRDEFIARAYQDQGLNMVAVAGTHGKTSTTALLVWVLERLDIPISHIVGSGMSFAPAGRHQPGSRWFVYEADEYDRNFLSFHPEVSLITTLDYDHPDTYPDETDYRRAFARFASQSDHIVTWPELLGRLPGKISTGATLPDEPVESIRLPGEHTRRNATLALSALEYITESSREAIVEAINGFPGVQRRMEGIAEHIYSDYAHHPIEIAATIQLARELADRVVVVYQPHQNIRQHQVKGQYAETFEGADKVYWLPTHLSREDPDLPVLSADDLMRYVDASVDVERAELDDGLAGIITRHAEAGDMVIGLGAGSIDTWLREHFQNR